LLYYFLSLGFSNYGEDGGRCGHAKPRLEGIQAHGTTLQWESLYAFCFISFLSKLMSRLLLIL
jgi:hypothetical protein